MIAEDASPLLALNSIPEVVRYTGDTPTSTLEDAMKLITDTSQPQFQKYKMGRFTVSLHDGTFLGWCGLKYFPEDQEVDLGYRLHPRYWGQGFATEASLASLTYGFGELKLKRIVARAMPANTASIKVLQKLKMTFRGLDSNPRTPRGLVLYDLEAREFMK